MSSLATSGYRVEPFANTGGYGADQITVSFTSFNTENIRCVALAVGSSTPSGSAINGGSATGQQGVSPAAASATGGATR